MLRRSVIALKQLGWNLLVPAILAIGAATATAQLLPHRGSRASGAGAPVDRRAATDGTGTRARSEDVA